VKPVTRLVLVGLLVSLVVGVGVSYLASPEPDGLEAAYLRTACADAADPEACLEEAAGEPVFDAAPLPDYEVTWLSGLLGVAACFAVGAGLVAAVRAGRARQPEDV
jgi:cobalt/nickel transport protein